MVGVVLSLASTGPATASTDAGPRAEEERPRFGLDVNHVIDLAGATMLSGGPARRAHVAAVALGVPPPARLGRGLPRHPRAGRAHDDVPRRRPDGAPHPPGRRRRSCSPAPMVSPFGLGGCCCSTSAVSLAIAGMGVAFIVSLHPLHACALDAERVSRTAAMALVVLAGSAGALGRDASKATVAVLTARRRHPRADPGGTGASRCCRGRWIGGDRRVGDGGPSDGVSIEVRDAP